jgi:hypothetical protein
LLSFIFSSLSFSSLCLCVSVVHPRKGRRTMLANGAALPHNTSIPE